MICTLLIYCFVFQHNQVTSTGLFQNYFVPLTSVYNYNTRKTSKGDMYVSGINTTLYGKRTAKYTGTILWNNLNINIRHSSSLNIFKEAKKFLSCNIFIITITHFFVAITLGFVVYCWGFPWMAGILWFGRWQCGSGLWIVT